MFSMYLQLRYITIFTEVVMLLLMLGGNVDYRPNTDKEFLLTTHSDECLRQAIRNKHMEIARMLLEHGANPNKCCFFGAEINLVTDLKHLKLLLRFGANANSRDRYGLTPLMKAASQPQGMEAVLLLINYGADVNAMADDRHEYQTVLHFAVLSGNIEIVNLLIEKGAKLNYDDVNDLGKPSPLHLAVLKGDPEIVAFLINSGANVNYNCPIIGAPLHVACVGNITNRSEILQKLLLEGGADPNLMVCNDIMDRNSKVRPVLVQYLASPESPSFPVLLNLIWEALVETRFYDPDWPLNLLRNVISRDPIFDLLLETCKLYYVCVVRRNNVISAEQQRAMRQLRRKMWRLSCLTDHYLSW